MTHLIYENMPFSFILQTYSNNKQVTDSAASATAFLTGVKSNQGTIGVDGYVRFGDCKMMNDPKHHVSSIMHDFQVGLQFRLRSKGVKHI